MVLSPSGLVPSLYMCLFSVRKLFCYLLPQGRKRKGKVKSQQLLEIESRVPGLNYQCSDH